MGAVEMDLPTKTTLAPRRTGYETLLYDCMIGGLPYFSGLTMWSWAGAMVTPILDV